jgi:hypothetical protein
MSHDVYPSPELLRVIEGFVGTLHLEDGQKEELGKLEVSDPTDHRYRDLLIACHKYIGGSRGRPIYNAEQLDNGLHDVLGCPRRFF